MSTIDVLIITALKAEYDAARDVALATREVNVGVAEWEERDASTSTPYLLGRYVAADRLSMNVALARPTRMGGTATSPVVASLVERLKPGCLAMCGVCAGNPGDVALGDVIIAEMVYPYDEGKQKDGIFEGDHRQTPMLDTWVRAAQDLIPDGLPSFGAASDKEVQNWLLERLYAGDDPRTHLARSRYFPGNTWEERVRAFEGGGLIRREGLQLVLTNSGRSFVEETLFYGVEGPRRLPFQIKVGPIASGNVVVKDGITWEKLKKWGVRSVLGLEMEAATIGSTAHRLGVPMWVVAKGVMDYADPRKDDRYKLFAARASAEVLFKFLSINGGMIQRNIVRDASGENVAVQYTPHALAPMVIPALIPDEEERGGTIRSYITKQIEVLRYAHGRPLVFYGDLTKQVPKTFLTAEIVRVIEQLRIEGIIDFDCPLALDSTGIRLLPQWSSVQNLELQRLLMETEQALALHDPIIALVGANVAFNRVVSAIGAEYEDPGHGASLGRFQGFLFAADRLGVTPADARRCREILTNLSLSLVVSGGGHWHVNLQSAKTNEDYADATTFVLGFLAQLIPSAQNIYPDAMKRITIGVPLTEQRLWKERHKG